MPKITLDTVLSSQLQELNQEVELCDPSGRLLGRFVPQIDWPEVEALFADVSEEELDRREQSTEWYTTAEVLAYLNNLEKP